MRQKLAKKKKQYNSKSGIFRGFDSPACPRPVRDNIKNMEVENMRFCGHLKDGTQLLLTDDEIINNALEQEKSGIKPHYCFYDYKEKKQ